MGTGPGKPSRALEEGALVRRLKSALGRLIQDPTYQNYICTKKLIIKILISVLMP